MVLKLNIFRKMILITLFMVIFGRHITLQADLELIAININQNWGIMLDITRPYIELLFTLIHCVNNWYMQIFLFIFDEWSLIVYLFKKTLSDSLRIREQYIMYLLIIYFFISNIFSIKIFYNIIANGYHKLMMFLDNLGKPDNSEKILGRTRGKKGQFE